MFETKLQRSVSDAVRDRILADDGNDVELRGWKMKTLAKEPWRLQNHRYTANQPALCLPPKRHACPFSLSPGPQHNLGLLNIRYQFPCSDSLQVSRPERNRKRTGKRCSRQFRDGYRSILPSENGKRHAIETTRDVCMELSIASTSNGGVVGLVVFVDPTNPQRTVSALARQEIRLADLED